MYSTPTLSDIRTIEAFASHQGNFSETAKTLCISEELARKRVLRVSRKANFGFRERKDPPALALKLEAWLVEVLAAFALVVRHETRKK
jgi:hypothetical protein